MGLVGVLKNDGSGWVSKHGGHNFFHASLDFTSWTIRTLINHKDILTSATIYDAIWAFKDRLELANMEVMRAIIECFWLASNTFVTPNGELEFYLKEKKEITGLPILGDIYEEYLSIESELEAAFEEFRALFF